MTALRKSDERPNVIPILPRSVDAETPRVPPLPMPVSAKSLGRPPTYNSLPAMESSSPSPSSHNGPRVLVVDPNRITQRLLVGCLRRNGCRVQTSHDPRSATRASADAHDLVMLSTDVSEADPVDIARHLQEYHPTQWVVLTGSGALDGRMREAGVRDVLAVPAAFDRLGALIDLLRGELALRESSRPSRPEAVDVTMLDALHADDPTTVREAIEMFMGETPDALARISEFHETGQARALHEECHSLSVGAGALGANHLASLAEGAAKRAAAGELEAIPELLAEIEHEYGLVFRVLMNVHDASSTGAPR